MHSKTTTITPPDTYPARHQYTDGITEHTPTLIRHPLTTAEAQTLPRDENGLAIAYVWLDWERLLGSGSYDGACARAHEAVFEFGAPSVDASTEPVEVEGMQVLVRYRTDVTGWE